MRIFTEGNDKGGFVILILLFLLGLGCGNFGYGEELPVPTFRNAVIISIEHSVTDSKEVDTIKNNFSFGLYAWLSFSHTALTPALAWHSDWSKASQGIRSFKDRVNQLIERAEEKEVMIHLVLCSGLARGLEVYREAKEEDIRNCQWYNDNKLADDDQISKPGAMNTYIFGTLSRYARKVRANLEAKSRAAFAFLKQKMDEHPRTLIALSGWGEAELNYHRAIHTKSVQDWFCDYSPFAVLEFRDWLLHAGMYDPENGRYRGEGWADGGTRYRGADGLNRFNADFGTDFKTWDIRYFHLSLDDDYDTNRIPFSSYEHGKMMPSSGKRLIPGGFDPPRIMEPGNKFWDLWNLFRETMVHNFVKDAAGWAAEAGIKPEKWYSHQIPGDYLFNTNPDVPNKNARYYTSASPLWTADIKPFGSAGATIYDIKFPEWFARSTAFSLPVISAMSPNWAIMEYDAETYPPGFDVSESPPEFILDQFIKVYNHNVHLINFWRWWDADRSHRIKGMNKETALRNFIRIIRDKARRTDLDFVFDPPRVSGLTGRYEPENKAVRLALTGKIWEGLRWEWKDWGDFSHFEIHAGDEPNFQASGATLLARTVAYSYFDSGVSARESLYYKVRAVNAKGIAGPFSREIQVPRRGKRETKREIRWAGRPTGRAGVFSIPVDR